MYLPECVICDPANKYMLKANNRNTRKRCEICSKLTTKTPKRRRDIVLVCFIVNFEHISFLFLVFLLLALNKWVFAWAVFGLI